MKSDDVNCFDALKPRKRDEVDKTANDQTKPSYLRKGSDSDLWNQGYLSLTLPQTDLIKLRIFSTIYNSTPEEVLAVTLRENVKNNGPDTMKSMFNNLDDNFSQKSDAN